MCTCNRYCLDQLNINYTYSYAFDDCNCSEDHELFAIKCENCLYNLTDFGKNYFASICCTCVRWNRNLACCHCRRLRYALNPDTIKVCLKKGDELKEFKLIEINKYLEKHLKADWIFYYWKEENEIKLSIDSLDWGDYFYDKETVNFFLFLGHEK